MISSALFFIAYVLLGTKENKTTMGEAMAIIFFIIGWALFFVSAVDIWKS